MAYYALGEADFSQFSYYNTLSLRMCQQLRAYHTGAFPSGVPLTRVLSLTVCRVVSCRVVSAQMRFLVHFMCSCSTRRIPFARSWRWLSRSPRSARPAHASPFPPSPPSTTRAPRSAPRRPLSRALPHHPRHPRPTTPTPSTSTLACHTSKYGSLPGLLVSVRRHLCVVSCRVVSCRVVSCRVVSCVRALE
jgi:hypothetical protein